MIPHHLPIGIQDFTTIRREGFYCVDKTPSSGSWRRVAATTSSPVPAASARACSSTRSGPSSRARRPCSGAWPSMTTGTGPHRRIRCCD